VTHAQQRGVLLFAQTLQQVHCGGGVGWVKARGGFIGEDERGLAGKGSRDGDALLLAHAEFIDECVDFGDAEFAEEFSGARLHFACGFVGHEYRRHDVFDCAETLQQVEGLKNDAQIAAAKEIARCAGECVDVLSGDFDGALLRVHETGDEIEERAFAAAAAGGEEELFALVEGESGDAEGEGVVGVAVGVCEDEISNG